MYCTTKKKDQRRYAGLTLEHTPCQKGDIDRSLPCKNNQKPKLLHQRVDEVHVALRSLHIGVRLILIWEERVKRDLIQKISA